MAQGNITIEFKAKGSEALTQAIKQLDVATNKLKGTTSVYEKELKDMGLTQKQVNKFLALNTKNARISAGAFATLRSKLLLVAFASGLLTKAFTSLSLYSCLLFAASCFLIGKIFSFSLTNEAKLFSINLVLKFASSKVLF